MDMELLLQMLEVATIGSQAGSQALTQPLHYYLISFCNLPHIEQCHITE